VRPCTGLARLDAAAKVREAGRLHSEGRDYLVQDGDLLLFRYQP
jgi:ribosome-binding ATPase YchF (GTP1/OBG family)